MAAATRNRDARRTPDSSMVGYTGSSGYHYYEDTMIMMSAAGVIQPAVQGAGASGAKFLGFAANELDLSGNLGSSQVVLNIYKSGIFTVNATGTGVSADIGKRAFIHDDQTVGVSSGFPCLYAGEIVGIPTTSTYRIIPDMAINQQYLSGISGFNYQN